MLLKNYAIMKRNYMVLSASNSGTRSYSTPKPKNFSGNDIDSFSYNAYTISDEEARVQLRCNTGFHIGTGTNVESVDDYCLGNEVTSSFNQASYTMSTQITADGKFETSFKYSAVNNSGNTLIISEVGIHHNDGTNNILFFRGLIPTPITVEAGQSINLIVKIAE